MRQRLGDRKVKRYADATGLDVTEAWTRGNTDHRVDLYTLDGTIWHYWPKAGRLQRSEWKWKRDTQ